MIGDPPLGVVIGADPLAAVAGAYLAFPLAGNGGVVLGLFCVIQSCAQHFHGLVFVFMLAALVLALHHRAGGQVGNANGGGGFVDVLPPCAGGAEGVDLQVLGVQLKVHFLRFRQHCDRYGGGVNATLTLRFRHPLHPVHPAFKLKAGVGAVAVNGKADFLVSAQLRGVLRQNFALKALLLRVHTIHTVQHPGKQGTFVAAGAAADLNNYIFVVVGIPGQQQNFQLLLQLFQRCLAVFQFFSCQIAQLRVAFALQQLSGFFRRRLGGFVAGKGLYHRG